MASIDQKLVTSRRILNRMQRQVIADTKKLQATRDSQTLEFVSRDLPYFRDWANKLSDAYPNSAPVLVKFVDMLESRIKSAKAEPRPSSYWIRIKQVIQGLIYLQAACDKVIESLNNVTG